MRHRLRRRGAAWRRRVPERPPQSVRVRRLPHGRRRTPRLQSVTNVRAIVLGDVDAPDRQLLVRARPRGLGHRAVRLPCDQRAAAHAERRAPVSVWRLRAGSSKTALAGVCRRRAVRGASDDDRSGRLHQRPVRSAVRDVLHARADERPPVDCAATAARWAALHRRPSGSRRLPPKRARRCFRSSSLLYDWFGAAGGTREARRRRLLTVHAAADRRGGRRGHRSPGDPRAHRISGPGERPLELPAARTRCRPPLRLDDGQPVRADALPRGRGRRPVRSARAGSPLLVVGGDAGARLETAPCRAGWRASACSGFCWRSCRRRR